MTWAHSSSGLNGVRLTTSDKPSAASKWDGLGTLPKISCHGNHLSSPNGPQMLVSAKHLCGWEEPVKGPSFSKQPLQEDT